MNIKEANETLNKFKQQGENRVRELREYFFLNYAPATEAIAWYYNSSHDEKDPILWPAVYPNMGLWRYDADMLMLRASSVDENQVNFDLSAMRGHNINPIHYSLPIALIECPLEEAIATVKKHYRSTFEGTENATLMDAEPPVQPDEPTDLGAIVQVDGKRYVHLGRSCWVREDEGYGYPPDRYSWNALRREGQIEVLFPGINL